MIRIKKIDWLDRETGEAFVLLSDGTIDLYCFADAFTQKVGGAFLGTIYEFEAGFAKKNASNELKCSAELIPNTDHSYNLFGRITEKLNLQVGEFVIDMPNDTFVDNHIGEFVVVDVMRLDLEDD